MLYSMRVSLCLLMLVQYLDDDGNHKFPSLGVNTCVVEYLHQLQGEQSGVYDAKGSGRTYMCLPTCCDTYMTHATLYPS